MKIKLLGFIMTALQFLCLVDTINVKLRNSTASKKLGLANITTTDVPVVTQKSNTKPHFPKKLGKGKQSKSKSNEGALPPAFDTGPKMITPLQIQQWANEISDELFKTEKQVVRREFLLKSFSNMKMEFRDGNDIVDRSAKALEDLLTRRSKQTMKIAQKAEELAKKDFIIPPTYGFDDSVDLDKVKPEEELYDKDADWPTSCRKLSKMPVRRSAQFDADVSLDATSVHVTQEIFPCDYQVVPDLYWSEYLLPTFQENYAEDAMTSFQYFCDAKGFLRHYPAASWDSILQLKLDEEIDVYDCRLRPWYVSAGGAPRDILILLDASGSMFNSSNKVIGEQFILALLTALTDDDQVNVLRFNVEVASPIDCFNDKLVPANHVNSAAMMAAMSGYRVKNETKMEKTLEFAVRMLQNQRSIPGRPPSCQQAIVLLADSIYANFTELMRQLDPEGVIRVFSIFLHDRYGLRDNTLEYGQALSCARDGYFAEMVSDVDVTGQVLRILQLLERPLVQQRRERIRVFSDLYANVEDPRKSEYHWQQKENEEQKFRYQELRKSKEALLSSERMYRDHMHQVSLDKFGQYFDDGSFNYRQQISVSVPVFDYVTSENITRVLSEEKQRKSTRTYPVNRLLGVAGIDIPVDELKLIFPYHELGSGGSFILLDHRGSIVIHENLRPLFDEDVLKSGYRSVDLLDVEQSAQHHLPRHYPLEWIQFRNNIVLDQPKGNKTMFAKHILENGMRALLEPREYFWRRVLDHYTAIVVLPKYGRKHAVPDKVFTQKLAQEAFPALSGTEFTVHPDWLYCRHVEAHFTTREAEVLHFVRRRSEEPDFPMKNLKHFFSPIPETVLQKTYQCNEQLMARLCYEAVATEQWAREHEKSSADRDCSTCKLGSIVAFIASESGLTRWQPYHATVAHADPPDDNAWPRGPAQPWYRRAAAAPGTLVLHAPVSPVRNMRNTFRQPPQLGVPYTWLTAARTLEAVGGGIIGVAGFHFYPEHFEDLLRAITNFQCPEEDETLCPATCDEEDWQCVVVDENGWVVDGGTPDRRESDPIRSHLAGEHPTVMAALLNHSVFKLHWIHDYQAVCFPLLDPVAPASSSLIPSLITSLWKTVYMIVQGTRELITLLALFTLTPHATADTEFEKWKRRRRLRKDYERERYETLYDARVRVNRTRFAACDRSRPMYLFQKTPEALAALTKPARICEWPLVGAVIPNTNLLLLAIYLPCPPGGRPVPDPLKNEQVKMTDEIMKLNDSDSRLACWRNRIPLPGRQTSTKCYPHQYEKEAGYRQCGPWRPDPAPDDGDGKPTPLYFGKQRASDSLASTFTTILAAFVVAML